MNANLNMNMNAYKPSSRPTSSDIRRVYLANTRKNELLSLFSVSAQTLRTIIFTLKAICAIVCVIGFFSVIGLIESGELSALSGIFYTVIIALLECACFIPVKSNRSGK